MKGREFGSKGYEGPTPTKADYELARRRFAEYVRLTKELEPFSYDAIDVIKSLPMDGGEKFLCGDTRFDHLINEKCRDLDKNENPERCEREMRNGKPCFRKIGHPAQCMSKDYWERNARVKREARVRKNASKEV